VAFGAGYAQAEDQNARGERSKFDGQAAFNQDFLRRKLLIPSGRQGVLPGFRGRDPSLRRNPSAQETDLVMESAVRDIAI
jgi:hypothetical protein